MTRNWLRGLLLGVSLALLLAGGVALAQRELSVTAEPYCFECVPEEFEAMPPEGLYTMLTMSGHPTAAPDVQPTDNGYLLCQDWFLEGEFVDNWCDSELPQEDPASAYLIAWCGPPDDAYGWFYMRGVEGGEFDKWLPWEYGEWTVELWVQSTNQGDVSAGEIVAGPAEAVFRVAEDCAEFEFVPEPGTIALLGSGLAGLAGYAALRWRTRE